MTPIVWGDIYLIKYEMSKNCFKNKPQKTNVYHANICVVRATYVVNCSNTCICKKCVSQAYPLATTGKIRTVRAKHLQQILFKAAPKCFAY